MKKTTIKETRARWQRKVNEAKTAYENFRKNFAPSEPSFYRSGAYKDINKRRKSAISRKRYEYKKKNVETKTVNVRTLRLPFIAAFSKKGKVFDNIVKKNAENKRFVARVNFNGKERYFRGDYSGFRLYISKIIRKISKSVTPEKDSSEILTWQVIRGLKNDKDQISVIYEFLKDSFEPDENDDDNDDDF